MALGDVHLGDVVASPHAAVAARLVSRSLHQLHVAADELRSCAHELVDCAVRIERDRDVAA